MGKTTHGMTGTPIYRVWGDMKSRCCNLNHSAYKDYGGRGIIVCPSWSDDFINFYNDMGDRPSTKHSIDRKDNNLGYFPDNCRWADKTTQSRNQRVRKTNTSGYPGVSVHKLTGKWMARIWISTFKRQYLGLFTDLQDAIDARKAAEDKYWK